MQAQNASASNPGLTIDTLRKITAELKKLSATKGAPLILEIRHHLKPARHHKKRRIRKKWLVRFGFVPDTSADKGDGATSGSTRANKGQQRKEAL